MPNKVRIVGQLAGRWYTGKFFQSQMRDYVEAWGRMGLKPADFRTWPKWKQAQWTYDQLKAHHVDKLVPMALHIFREPRGARDSRYVAFLKSIGMGKKIRKPQREIREKRERQAEQRRLPIPRPARIRFHPLGGARVLGGVVGPGQQPEPEVPQWANHIVDHNWLVPPLGDGAHVDPLPAEWDDIDDRRDIEP